MAATRAMQAAGETVTASAPMSGPYALAAFGDAIFSGEVNYSATENVALLANGYQNAYGNLYSEPTEVFATPYAGDIAGLLPSTTPISTIYAAARRRQRALQQHTARPRVRLGHAGDHARRPRNRVCRRLCGQ